MEHDEQAPVEAATFDNTLHARLAAGFLADADIPALVDSSQVDDPFRNTGPSARVRLLVPSGRLDEARGRIVGGMSQISRRRGRFSGTPVARH